MNDRCKICGSMKLGTGHHKLKEVELVSVEDRNIRTVWKICTKCYDNEFKL